MPIILLSSLWFAPYQLPLIILEEQLRIFRHWSAAP